MSFPGQRFTSWRNDFFTGSLGYNAAGAGTSLIPAPGPTSPGTGSPAPPKVVRGFFFLKGVGFGPAPFLFPSCGKRERLNRLSRRRD